MTEQPLFDGYEPPEIETEQLSAGQRLTRRQADQILHGIHPLTLNYALVLPLHRDADRTRTRESAQDGTPTCGNCLLRRPQWDGGYPKCMHSSAPVSNAATTDVRAWWPACIHHIRERSN